MNYLDTIIDKLSLKQNIFLTGGAGVGKTTITRDVIKHYNSLGKKVASLASTGIAATLLNGQTLHSFLDLGIASNLEELELNSKLEIKKKIKKLISAIDLIVIDEVSMVSDSLFNMIKYRLNQANFLGVVLVVGDFLQLPPVSRFQKDVNFAFESSSWKEFNFQTIELTHIYRTDDIKFIELLHSVRFGKIDEVCHNKLNEYIKPLPDNLSEFTFLFGKNITASNHNKKQLSFIDNELFIKEVQIIKHSKNIKDIDIERFIKDSRIEKELELKIGVPVLFTRNSWNYFNGQKAMVIGIEDSFISLQKADGKIIKLETVAQSKTKWIEKDVDGKKEMIEEELFTIYQFPIKLAFAITIHKSQGMSIEDLIIETNEIFAPSQFYVALSRSCNPKRLNLIAPKRQWHELVFVNNKALEFVNNYE
ncbi:MAG: DEAD/DEAH box helicase [Campylobacterota bacterium]|nr:DEAD/DEAH box helicase [Campylobacterota bacterium]